MAHGILVPQPEIEPSPYSEDRVLTIEPPGKSPHTLNTC